MKGWTIGQPNESTNSLERTEEMYNFIIRSFKTTRRGGHTHLSLITFWLIALEGVVVGMREEGVGVVGQLALPSNIMSCQIIGLDFLL